MKERTLWITAFIFSILYLFFLPKEVSYFYDILIPTIPTICLLLIFFTSKSIETAHYDCFIIFGLLFFIVGQLTHHWFIIGLFFFLIGHLFYIHACLTIRQTSPSKIATLCLLFYGIVLAAWVGGNIFKSGAVLLGLVVLFYIAVMLTIGWATIQTRKWILLFSAILLIMSDSIFMINMFVTTIDGAAQWTLGTYLFAQFLFIFHFPEHFEIRKKVLE
ncbi:lysoplasmalogenase family protein [Kurthia sp. FSL E2-0154]|uniref:lysoplasmalogenase family protein n=1 Tax=Kurthia sp. FSL E2-0154 TaxID=2921358 RepID=UPI0030F71BB1